MLIFLRFLIVAWLAVGSAFGFSFDRRASTDSVASTDLPREARQTLDLIKQGGPFPYERDGITFGNFEKRLPLHPRGYYREYTVKTPGVGIAAHAASFPDKVASITTPTITTAAFGEFGNRC